MKRIIILSILLSIAFLMSSCAPTVSQQEYDMVKDELNETQSQLESLQSELAEAQMLKDEYDRLNDDYGAMRSELEILQAKHDELDVKYDELGAEYDELDAKYDDLSEQYNVLLEGMPITEEEVEQAIFELINKERRDNELDELEWGKNLYKWAKSNSRDMATSGSITYSGYVSWQEVFWAAGYSTTDRIANAALITWQTNQYGYEHNILSKSATYGAVGAYKSGEIFYITYVAHIFR